MPAKRHRPPITNKYMCSHKTNDIWEESQREKQEELNFEKKKPLDESKADEIYERHNELEKRGQL